MVVHLWIKVPLRIVYCILLGFLPHISLNKEVIGIKIVHDFRVVVWFLHVPSIAQLAEIASRTK